MAYPHYFGLAEDKTVVAFYFDLTIDSWIEKNPKNKRLTKLQAFHKALISNGSERILTNDSMKNDYAQPGQRLAKLFAHDVFVVID